MKIAVRVFVYAILCCNFTLLSAQSPNILLTYQKSDSLFVCGTDTFTVTIQNTGSVLAAGGLLNIALPNGVSYVVGGVTGATQQNITDLQNPAFSLPAISTNGTVIVKLILTADCAAADVLDAGGLFLAHIAVTAPNASASLTTTSIPVETGLILIQSVSDILMQGEKFDTLYRKICVKNTRLGKIGNLHFEDQHLAGFDIAVAGAATQTNTTAFFQADFTPAFFATTGNGDHWLDIGESVCFTERVIITDCGIPEFLNPSLLRVGWGCGPELCRYDSMLVNIQIKQSTKVPDLRFTQIWNPPTDHCAQTGATMGLKIKNTGLGKAENVSIKLDTVFTQNAIGMNPASFRIRNSNGSITSIVPNLIVPAVLSGCQVQAAGEVSLTIPLIASMDSLELLFDALNCEESCQQTLPYFYVEYFYRKPCPVNGFVSDTMLITPNNQYNIVSKVDLHIEHCLVSGSSYPAVFEVNTKRLTEANGFLHVEFDLPHGITLDNNCGTLLAGMAPLTTATSPAPGGGLQVHLAYALPLPQAPATMNFCLHYECDSSMVCVDPPYSVGNTHIIYATDCAPCFGQMSERAYWTPTLNTPYVCGIGDCHGFLLAMDASCSDSVSNSDGDSSGLAPALPAGYRWKMDVSRINFGLRDQDDNRVADDGSTARAEEIRLDRYLAGDTSRVTYCGVLDSGEMQFFHRLIWHEVTKSDEGGIWGNDSFSPGQVSAKFTNAQNLRFVHDSLRIHYANGTMVAFRLNDLISTVDQNIFSVNVVNSNPPASIDVIVTQRHTFQISLPDLFAQGLLPKPTLNTGDSIFFYTDFKLDVNFNPLKPGQIDPPLIGFRTAVGHSGKLYAWNAQSFKRMQYTGFVARRSANTFSIKPCDESIEAKKFRYSVRIARENLFPFEVRPLAKIVDYRQTVPGGLTVSSAKLNYLALQDSIPWLSNVALPFSQTPDLLHVNFAPVFAQPIDEGFELGTNIVFDPNCIFAKPDTSKQWITTLFNECLNGVFPLITDSIRNNIGFFASHPELAVFTTDSVVNSPTRPFVLNFILKNPVISPATHPWLTIQSPSGMATDFMLFKMPQNQAIAAQNGIFNLSAINGLSQTPYRVTGNNISCETDTLLLIFGWDCGSITDLSQSSCYRDTYLIRLNLEKPELELNILQEPTSITLCDTSDYFEFEIYNAKIGYAYELFGSAKLPNGLRIVPGTSQLFYPTVGVWADITDPTLLPGNLYQWNISDDQAFIQAYGLPGVNLSPQNIVRIRFRTLAECGFVANTQNIYGTYGKEPCGRSTNILNKPGEHINIEGLNTAYEVTPQIQPIDNLPVACGGEQEFSVQITTAGAPSVGDSAIIILPQGATFVAGSYVPGANAPTGPPTLTSTGIQIALPLITGGFTMQFTFKVLYGPGSGCIDQTISVQTRVRTQAFCQSLGAPCDVYVSTGEYNLTLHIQHPELALGAVQTTLNGTQAGISININNIGTYLAAGATAQIWQDLDGSHSVTAGDVLLQTLLSSEIINPGGSIVLSGNLDISPAQWCGLMIVLPASENCICSDDVFILDMLTIDHELLGFCTLAPVSVGVDMLDGFHYHWQNYPGIACDTCATTVFTTNTNLPAAQVQTLILEESSASCTIIHHFNLSFGAIAQISSDLPIICAGQFTKLVGNPPNAIYYWEGPGITMPANQSQTVYPGASAVYTLTTTMSNGCTISTTFEVTVLPSDTITLPVIEVCEGAIINVLGTIMPAAEGIFHVSVLNANGCDSTIFQPVKVLPKPFTEESITFCAGTTVMVFDTIPVTTSTQVCRVFQASNTCDSTHCINTTAVPAPVLPAQDTIFSHAGTAIQLGGILGYANYDWTPEPNPPCFNCPVITVQPDSAGTYEYVLTVHDANGCSDELIWRLVVFPPCDPKNVMIPNAFTPNNDGANDVFRPIVSEGGELVGKLTIFDRWGEKVYENAKDVYWDGTVKGKPGSSDVYVYIIEVLCSGEKAKRVGEVTLLR